VVLGTNPTPPEKRVTELLAERIKDRSGVSLAKSAGKSKYQLVIGTAKSNDKIKAFSANRKDIVSLGTDGYCIVVDTHEPELYVIGQSDSGVVAGVGKLMRQMRYKKGKLEIPELQISEIPQMPNRGMYLWARKHYFAKPDQAERYIEEFALWGCNAICLWFEMAMFESFDEPKDRDAAVAKNAFNFHGSGGYGGNLIADSKAQDWIRIYRRIYATARRMGMKTGLLMAANDAYISSPKALRISPIIGCPNHYLCPSKPGSVEHMIANQEQVFKALAPIDIFNIFPADAGGCSCKECTPWPTQGLWRIARPLGDKIHEISPDTEIWIDTWHLNHSTFGGKDWKNLVERLNSTQQTPAWFAGFEAGLAPHHKYARMAPEDRDYYNKAKQPIMLFSEISMWKNHRGMLVKKEYWKQLQDEITDYSPELMKGGWPYCERWNTDIASVMFLNWYWDTKKPVDTVLDEYASFYFGPEAKTARALFDLLDDSNQDPQRKQKIRQLFTKLENTVPQWVKNDWRWNEFVQSCSRFK